jgi:hypothetical protein
MTRRDAVAGGGGWHGDLSGWRGGGVAPGLPSPVTDSPSRVLGFSRVCDSILQHFGRSREKHEAKSLLLGSMP